LIPSRFHWCRPLALLLLATLLAGMTGCVQLDLADVSAAPAYQSMIGREFELQTDMLIKGVKRDLRSTRPDYILLMPAPGIGGNEIFSLGTIPRGRRFRIVGVIDRKNRLLSKPQYVVQFSGAPITDAIVESIQIYNVSGLRVYLPPESKDRAPRLDPAYFRNVTTAPPTP
jgi:hypothetical protein